MAGANTLVVKTTRHLYFKRWECMYVRNILCAIFNGAFGNTDVASSDKDFLKVN